MMKSHTVAILLTALISCWTWADETQKPHQAGEYPHTADSLEQAQTPKGNKVPKGKLEGPFEFHSKVFAGTVRQYWIYVPAHYKAKSKIKPSLLVFQDGQRAINPKGSLRVPTVLDNLIHQKVIPQTIGVFITPGNLS